MIELALNILDIATNSVKAKASLVEITVKADVNEDKLTIIIKDDGKGMSEEFVKNVTDPFTTTRTTRKVGLGVPLFKQSADKVNCVGIRIFREFWSTDRDCLEHTSSISVMKWCRSK